MSAGTDADIAAWQQHAGLRRPSCDVVEMLREMQQQAFELIQAIELECAGIRDGDGVWHGCDPVDDTVRDIARIWAQVRAAERVSESDL